MSQVTRKSIDRLEIKNYAKTPDSAGILIACFALAFAISWLISVPLTLANQGIIPAILPSWSHYLAAFGPMVAALIVTWVGQGLPGVKDLTRRRF